jgi:hypothetical protein
MHKTKGSYVLKALVAVMFLGVGTAAHAKKPKISILHCGVDEVTETMVYNTISVSKASKGHANHVVGSIDSEGTGEFAETGEEIIEEIFVDYVRTGADCLLEGEGDLPICGDLGVVPVPEEGQECGSKVGPAV